MTRLEQVRLDRHLTIRDLARLSGVARQTLYDVERRGSASDTVLFKLADTLDLPASTLLLPAVPAPEDVAA